MNNLFTTERMHMKSTLILAAGALGVLLCAQAAANEYSALLRTHKYAEVERTANARLAQEPGNADALVARSDAILGSGALSRLEEAVKLGEQCVAAHPQVSNCHLALGNALGTKAMSAGIMSAMGYAGTIRDAFKKAVELDPQNMEARLSLLQYYMSAPSIVGGGTSKAQALAAQTASLNSEGAKLMLAQLDASDDKLAKAEATVLAMPVSSYEAVADGQRDLMITLGNKYLGDKKYADSERLYREAMKRFPDSEVAVYGMARVQQEQGKHRDAIAGMDQSIAMYSRAAPFYRIGQSQQALDDKVKAMAAYEKALSFKTGMSPKMKADAESQLNTLRK
jgi:tetratricopeptide (TPR) repeat protein